MQGDLGQKVTFENSQSCFEMIFSIQHLKKQEYCRKLESSLKMKRVKEKFSENCGYLKQYKIVIKNQFNTSSAVKLKILGNWEISGRKNSIFDGDRALCLVSFLEIKLFIAAKHYAKVKKKKFSFCPWISFLLEFYTLLENILSFFGKFGKVKRDSSIYTICVMLCMYYSFL